MYVAAVTPPLLIVQWGRESFEQFDYDYLLAYGAFSEQSADRMNNAAGKNGIMHFENIIRMHFRIDQFSKDFSRLSSGHEGSRLSKCVHYFVPAN